MDFVSEIGKGLEGKLTNDQLRLLKERLRNTKINVLLVGGTGVGKSSTINALLEKNQATVGTGTQPETDSIEKYEYNNMIIWDTPGLGDSTENDAKYKKIMVEKLNEKTSDGTALIDLVFLILDGGSRDYSSAYTLIKEVIAPNLGQECSERLLVGINQADMAMKGKYWDEKSNQPEFKLIEFLEDKVRTTKERIYQDSGLEVMPIYYSAGYTDDKLSQKPYNMAKLLDTILGKLPEKKRVVLMSDVSRNQDNFELNDKEKDYGKEIEQKIGDSIWANIKALAEVMVQKTSTLTKEIINSVDKSDVYEGIKFIYKVIKPLFMKGVR